MRVAVATVVGLALTSCDLIGGSSAPVDPLSCFPEASREFVARTTTAQAPAGEAVQRAASSATVYVDRSGSMVGYLAGATPTDRPFTDLVRTLPETLRSMGLQASTIAFGRTISQPIADTALLTTPGFFSCGSVPQSDCEAAESHIDAVLTQVAAKPDELAIIISDLWFYNSATQGSGVSELKPALASILESDRAIAVYGFAAPFDGMIHDLPAPPGQQRSVEHKGRHPLYLLAIGSDAQVAAFREQLAKSSSRGISGAIREGMVGQSLFSVSPLRPALVSRTPLSAGSSEKIVAGNFELFSGLAVQQFTFDRRAEEVGADGPAFPMWRAPDDAIFVDNAVREGPMQFRLRAWRKRDAECGEQWTELNLSALDWPQTAAGSKMEFSLDPALLRGPLRSEGDYLLVGELNRVGAGQEVVPSIRWMADWSLAHEAYSYRLPGGDLFPTMNIDEFARLMQTSLDDAARKQNKPLTGFTIMVRSTGS